MKTIPYYLIGATYLMICFFAGGAIWAGAGYMRDMARADGVASALIYLELEQLGEVETHEL